MPSKKSSADIVVDARMIRHSGIGTYLRGILSEYPAHRYFQNHSLGLALSQKLLHDVNGLTPNLFSFESPIYSLSEQAHYLSLLNQARVWHAPHYNIPYFKKKARLVVTIHDLIHWIFRKEYYSSLQSVYARVFLNRVVQLADKIIAVSNQTKDDLIQFFKARPEKIEVIYEGVSPSFFQAPEIREQKEMAKKYDLPERYFLYVGLIKPHKNVKRLVDIFLDLKAENKIKADLVLVGKKDAGYFLKIGAGVHHYPYVESQKELACLYASALSLIHPSFYEGFGLTCLEAMATGTPVIVSRVASLPEVVGEAGYYIDPYQEDTIRAALIELDENESLRRDLTEKGKLRARQFNWKKAAEKTIQVYQEVLGS